MVLIDSVSKRYSECGIRIGALITKNAEVRSAVMKFCQARLSPPLIGQIAAEASLDASEEYARETYDEYVERRKCLLLQFGPPENTPELLHQSGILQYAASVQQM